MSAREIVHCKHFCMTCENNTQLGLGDGFRRIGGFPPLVTMASHDLAEIWQKKWQKLKFGYSHYFCL